MSDTGDAIRVSLEDIAERIRILAARRIDFPAPASVAETRGPAGAASRVYWASLVGTTAHLARMTKLLTTHLQDVEKLLAATGRDLVAADETVAGDLDSLERILGTVDEPTGPRSAPPGTSSGSTAFA